MHILNLGHHFGMPLYPCGYMSFFNNSQSLGPLSSFLGTGYAILEGKHETPRNTTFSLGLHVIRRFYSTISPTRFVLSNTEKYTYTFFRRYRSK